MTVTVDAAEQTPVLEEALAELAAAALELLDPALEELAELLDEELLP